MEKKSKVLVVGGTGFIGKKLVEASLREGHETFVLQRSTEIGLNIDKLQILLGFKKKGVRLVEGSFSDHQSLVEAVKKADVVISAISGDLRTHSLLMQLKLIDAIKDAGNLKRFLPSEYGMDPSRMGDAMEPGRRTFDDKMEVRRAIEASKIPFTYISANCFAAKFAGNLSQVGTFLPPKGNLLVYGEGSVKVSFVDEDDAATYILKAATDSRTLNKTIYIRPPDNVLSQLELIRIWEKLSGKELTKKNISAEEFLSMMEGANFYTRVVIGHVYHIYYESCLTNFDLGDDEEASKLYPDVEYKRMDEYLKIYLPD